MAGVELLPIVFSLALSEISSQAVNEASQASLAHRFGCHLAHALRVSTRNLPRFFPAHLHARGSEMNPAKNTRIRDFGDRDRAIAELEKGVQTRSLMPFVFADPQLDSLRSDPRFQQLLRRAKLPS